MLKFNNIVLKYDGKWLFPIESSDLNPLNLPPNTVRVRTSDGNAPIRNISTPSTYETATRVAGTTDVFDVYKSGNDFSSFIKDSTNLVEVLGANTTGITYMESMFAGCYNLTSVPLFDTSSAINMRSMFRNTSITSVPLYNTSNVRQMYAMFKDCKSLITVPLFDMSNVFIMHYMFDGCTSLTSVPLFDTSKAENVSYMFNGCTSLKAIPLFNTSEVYNMDYMFKNCINVQSGALALYNQVSTQADIPSTHIQTFYSCGSNTVTGAAELAQIPSDWK